MGMEEEGCMREKLVDPHGRNGLRLRFLTAMATAALFAPAATASAGASVTLGQLAPVNPPFTCTGGNVDFAQTVTAGNTYVVPVPSTGTITSWSHSATAGAGQNYTFKVFRKIADPAIFQVVGHDGPRTLTPSTVNTFPANIAVKAGDFIGFHGAAVNHACVFPAGVSESYWTRNPSNLNDGESGAFGPFGTNNRLNISAVFNPTNAFTLGAITRNKKKGTATITADLPNPGELTGSGKGVKAAGAAVISKAVSAPGIAKLTIRAKGKKKRKLNETGKVKLKVAITYTPTGGDPRTQPRKLKLKKNL
jgi:hypothetical protein